MTEIEFKPGKGFFGDGTKSSLEFFSTALQQLRMAYDVEGGDDAAENNPKKFWVGVKNYLMMDQSEDDDILWHQEEDKFGLKVWAGKKWGKNEYRVTFVLTRQGECKVDVRSWYPG